jgi:hypothetical protein
VASGQFLVSGFQKFRKPPDSAAFVFGLGETSRRAVISLRDPSKGRSSTQTLQALGLKPSQLGGLTRPCKGRSSTITRQAGAGIRDPSASLGMTDGLFRYGRKDGLPGWSVSPSKGRTISGRLNSGRSAAIPNQKWGQGCPGVGRNIFPAKNEASQSSRGDDSSRPWIVGRSKGG